MDNSKTIEEIYQKKTQLEHILLRPDTYVGSIESTNQQLYVFDNNLKKIVSKNINYVPGLYKIFGNNTFHIFFIYFLVFILLFLILKIIYLKLF